MGVERFVQVVLLEEVGVLREGQAVEVQARECSTSNSDGDLVFGNELLCGVDRV